MKKLTKIFSMALAIAMTLSVTAMAATTSTEVNTDPNAYAFYNYLHRDYVWNKGWNGTESHPWAYYHRENINRSTCSDNDALKALETSSVHNYKLMPNYKSAYGAPLETWNYLNSRYETTIANRWYDLLMAGFNIGYDSRNPAAAYNDATYANEYLTAVTTNLDDGFVYLYENYGESVALKYAKSFYSIVAGATAFPGYSYVGCNDGGIESEFLTAQEWLEALATDPVMPLVYQPINMAPMNGMPVANDPNKAVTSKMTMQVNGVAQTFDVMTLHNTTYVKLADMANAIGFKYHETNTVTGGPCISNGANFTLHFSNLSDKGCGDITGATPSTILVNGIEYSFCSVYSMDAHSNGAVYYRLRDIAQIMNFNIGWTAKTGTTISNKSSFNEGVNGKPGENSRYVIDTSKWNEATHTFNK